MNKCFCFCAALIVYIIFCFNVTMIIISWIKPEILSPDWWLGKNKFSFQVIPPTTKPKIYKSKTNESNYKIYWNLPSIVCSRFGYTYTYVEEEYGITMNKGDSFKGNQITILYNPGLFPNVLNYTDESSLDDIVLINGGIPQDGNIIEHLEAFEEVIIKDIPDPDNDGLVIIDMEQWGVIWEQNFNSMLVNHWLSIKRVQNRHPDWTIQEVTKLAKQEYNIAAKRFMLITLRYGKALRPMAKWGYYQYPQCFNRPRDTPNTLVSCSKGARAENDRVMWLYKASDLVFPSAYLPFKGTVNGRAGMIRGIVQESKRIEGHTSNALGTFAYIWQKYFHKDGMILDEDLENLLKIPKEEGCLGVVMWGAYDDFKSPEKCLKFSKWLNTSFGPIAKQILNS